MRQLRKMLSMMLVISMVLGTNGTSVLAATLGSAAAEAASAETPENASPSAEDRVLKSAARNASYAESSEGSGSGDSGSGETNDAADAKDSAPAESGAADSGSGMEHEDVIISTPIPTEAPVIETPIPTEEPIVVTPTPTEWADPSEITETPLPTEWAEPTETPNPEEPAEPTETPTPIEDPRDAAKNVKKAPRKVAAAESASINDFVISMTHTQGEVGEDTLTNLKTVLPLTDYAFKVTFAEGAERQFPNAEKLIYQLPAGFHPYDQEGSFNIVIDGKIIPTTFHVYPAEGEASGYVEIKPDIPFEDSADDRTRAWVSATDVQFSIDFKGTFIKDKGTFNFGGEGDDNTYQNYETPLYKLDKQGKYNKETNTIDYTITVTGTQGTCVDLELKDIVSGDAIKIQKDTITCDPADGREISELDGDDAGKEGFKILFDMLQKGDVRTITYTADVDLDEIDGYGSFDDATNTVSGVNGLGKTVESRSNMTGLIKWTSIEKTGEVTENGDAEVRIGWEVVINEDANNALKNRTITDHMQSIAPSTIKGDVTVTIKDKDGNVIDTDTIAADGKDGWEYKVDDNEPRTYVFTYTSVTDKSKIVTSKKVDNSTSMSGGASGGASVGIPIDGDKEMSITKTLTHRSYDDAEWKIVVTLPNAGLDGTTTLTDTLPQTNGLIDDLVDDSVTVAGLYDGQERYTSTYDAKTGKLVLQFYKTVDGTETEGLLPNADTASGKRQLTITLKTENNTSWLKNYKDTWHENKAEFSSQGQSVSDSESYLPVEAGVSKRAEQMDSGTIRDADTLPAYRYTVRLDGMVDAPITLGDRFDEHFKYVDTDVTGTPLTVYVYGSDNADEWLGTGGAKGTVPVDPLISGNEISITLDNSHFPVKQNGQYYNYYYFNYYLQVKDDAAMTDLMKSVLDNGRLLIRNTAVWGSKSGKTDVQIEFKDTDKKVLEGPKQEADGHYWVTYEVIANPDMKKMSNTGSDIQVIDEFTNLAIDYNSIEVEVLDSQKTPIPKKSEIGWDVRGVSDRPGTTRAYFSIPDETKVRITYKSKVLGKPGETVQTKNGAYIANMTVADWITQNVELTSGGQGTGNIYKLHVVKYEGAPTSSGLGNMKERVSGAVFRVYDGKEEEAVLVTASSTSTHFQEGDPVEYVTDDNGEITLDGNDFSFPAGKYFYLKEVEAPEGYELNSTWYSFRIDKDGITDFSTYTYANGDQMSVRNTPISTELELTGTKNYDGDLSKDTFEFKVTDAKGNLVTTGRSDKDGKIAFDKIAYTWNGLGSAVDRTFTYYVSEVIPEKPDTTIVYDSSVKTIKVRVQKETAADGTQSMTAKLLDSSDSLTFNNEVVNMNRGSLKIRKEVTINGLAPTDAGTYDPSDADGTYNFTITRKNAPEGEEPKTAAVQIVNGRSNTVTVANLKPGTYIVHEVTDGFDGSLSLTGSNDVEIEVTAKDEGGVLTAEFTNNKKVIPKTRVSAKKIWENVDGTAKAPSGASVTYELLADGEPVTAGSDYLIDDIAKAENGVIVLDGRIDDNGETDDWTATFEGLRKYKKGTEDSAKEEIAYTIREQTAYGGYEVVDAKDTTSPGGSITNKQIPTDVEITFDKKWLNADESTTAPVDAAIELELYADGKPTGKTITLDGKIDTVQNDDGGTGDSESGEGGSGEGSGSSGGTTVPATVGETVEWKANFGLLPKFTPGTDHEIVYTVKETEEGAFAAYKANPEVAEAGGTMTNERVMTELSAAKQWKDEKGNIITGTDIPSGATVTFRLLVDGKKFDELDAALQEDLLKAGGKTEITLDGTVDTDTSGTPEKTGETEAWKAYFGSFPKFVLSTGREFTYRIEEVTTYPTFDRKTGQVANGGTIVNQRQSTSVTVTKKWANADGSDKGPVNGTVVFELFADNVTTGKTVTLKNGATANWTTTFRDLPKYKVDGDTTSEISYTVKEVSGPAGFDPDTTIGTEVRPGGTIINLQQYIETVSATKTWLNADGTTDAPNGASVQYTLFADGVSTGKVVTLNGTVDIPEATDPDPDPYGESSPWTAEFRHLAKFRLDTDGKAVEIVYTVKETTKYGAYEPSNTDGGTAPGVTGVTAPDKLPAGTVYDNGNILNKEPTVDLAVSKDWFHADGSKDVPDGAKVKLMLVADGTDTEREAELDGTVDTAASNPNAARANDPYGELTTPWTAEFKSVPKYRKGSTTPIVYTVREIEGWPQYTAANVTAADQQTVTMTNRQETVNVIVKKDWKNADGTANAPTGATVTYALFADGTKIKEVVLDGKKDTEDITDVDRCGEFTAWQASFLSLPKNKIENGAVKDISYTVQETVSWPGYTKSAAEVVSGQTILNAQDTVDVRASKSWLNADGSTEARGGATATFTLYADGTATSKKVTLDGKKDAVSTKVDRCGEFETAWTAEFRSLPKYKIVEGAAVEIVYTVVEETPYGGYTAAKENGGTKPAAAETEADDLPAGTVYDGGTIQNVEQVVSISAAKAWKNADGTTEAPTGAKVTFSLVIDGTTSAGKVVELDGTSDTEDQNDVDRFGEFTAWKAEFKSLPKYHPGTTTEYVYQVEETTVYPGYTASAGAAASESESVSGEGSAAGSSATGGATSANIRVSTGGTITNTQDVVDISATKAWKNADGTTTAPKDAKVTYTLLADGNELNPTRTVELDGEVDEFTGNAAEDKTDRYGELTTGWKAEFKSLPKYKLADGKAVAIVYTMQESVTWPGYTKSAETVADGGLITNTQDVVSISASKEWKNADGTADAPDGAKVTYTLLADGVATDRVAVLNGKLDTEEDIAYAAAAKTDRYGELTEGWKAEFTSLPKYKLVNGAAVGIVYTVQESVTWPGYTASVTDAGAAVTVGNGGVITNTQDTVSISANKAWVNADGTTDAPEGAKVTYMLLADGEELSPTRTVVLDGDVDESTGNAKEDKADRYGELTEGWKAEFTSLPKYKLVDGKAVEIKYTVQESVTWPGYTKSADPVTDNGVITNTQDVVDISATKAWRQADGKTTAPDGAKVTFALVIDGVVSETQKIELDGTPDELSEEEAKKVNRFGEFTAWTAEFKSLPKYKLNAEGEEELINYQVKEVGTYAGYLVSAKEAENSENGDTNTGSEGSGSEGSNSAGSGSESNGSAGSGSENNTGAETGSGSESNGSGTGSAGDTVSTGGIITNTQETIVVIATKTWENYDKSTDAPDGATVTFKLYADEVATGKQVVLDGEPETLSETEADPYGETAAWTAEFRSLPKYQADGTTEIVYTIEESVKYPGYTPDKDKVGDKGTIKNEEDKTSVTVTKVWENADGSNTAPAGAEVTFELYEDGEATGQKAVLNAENGWTAAFVNLQKNVRGTENEHVYVVKEVEGVPDYTNKDPDGAADGGTITNAQDVVSISAAKAWKNADGTDTAPEGAKVTYTLLADGEELNPTRTVVLDGKVDTAEANPNAAATKTDRYGELTEGWKAEFTSLPKYHPGTKDPYTYTVKESADWPGYTKSEETVADGGTITNTQDVVDISATKAWKNADGTTMAPKDAKVTYTLLADGEELNPTRTVELDGEVDKAEGNTATDKTDRYGELTTGWKAEFTSLPKYTLVNGEAVEIVYTVQESVTWPGYTKSAETVADGGVITNTQDVVSISASKEWKNADGTTTAPKDATVTYTLLADGVATDRVAVLNGKPDTEEDIAYAAAAKTDRYGELTEGWKAEFTSLPKYKLVDGKAVEIAYTVQESVTWPGYTKSADPVADNGVITNTQDTVSISANKAWVNADGSTDAPEGAKVTYTLLADGEELSPTRTVVLDGEVDESTGNAKEDKADRYGELTEGWKAEFTSLPKYKLVDGKAVEIKYTVQESVDWPGYTKSEEAVENGKTITNTQDVVDISATKAWRQADGKTTAPDGAKVTFALVIDGTVSEMQVIELDGTPDEEDAGDVDRFGEFTVWTAEFKSLPKYKLNAEGEEELINYQVKEVGTYAGYLVSAKEADDSENGDTNTGSEGSGPKTDSGSEGSGSEGSNAEGSGSKGNGSEGNGSEGSGSENNTGAETGSGSESNGSGTGSAGDTVSTGGIITNTQETIVVIATKTWENYDKSTDAPDGATVTFKLYANEVATGKQVVLDGEPETLSETEADPCGETAAWTAEFRSLPKYQADGTTEIVYTIEESVKYPGYTPDKDSVGDKGTIKNEEDKTSVTVTKVWDNADGSNTAPAGAEVTFELYEDGEATGQKAVLNETNGWTAAFLNLQKYVRGSETAHEYVVREVGGVPDYTNKDPDGAKDGGTITNAQDVVSISASKAWKNADGTDTAPEGAKVTYTLLADGEELNPTRTVVLDGKVDTAEANPNAAATKTDRYGELTEGWKAEFTSLPKYKLVDGKAVEIVYTVQESVTWPGYTKSADPVANNGVITNTQDVVDISATKAWKNADGTTTAPEDAKVTYTLLADGEELNPTRTVVLDGKIDTAEANPNAAATKTDRYGELTTGWKAEFTSLPKYKLVNGEAVEIAYTVKETGLYGGYTVDGPDTVSTGGTITNKQEAVEISASKAWKNADGTDTAPTGAQVTYTLVVDGNDSADRVIVLDGVVDGNAGNAAATKVDRFGEFEKWKAAFTGLPKYHPGTQTEYKYEVKESVTWPGYTPSVTDAGAVAASETGESSEDGEGSGAEGSIESGNAGGSSAAAVVVGNGGVITNTQDIVSISANKAWVNADGSTDAPEGAKVTYTLLADGEELNPTRTVELDGKVDTAETNPNAKEDKADRYGELTEGWKAEFTSLPKYKLVDGKAVEIKYTVQESVTWPGYTASAETAAASGEGAGESGSSEGSDTEGTASPVSVETDGTITNTQDVVDISATKAWRQADGKTTAPDGAKVTFALVIDGTVSETQKIELDGTPDELSEEEAKKVNRFGEFTAWTAEFKSLPKYKLNAEGEKELINYQVKEVGTYAGYLVSAKEAKNSESGDTNTGSEGSGSESSNSEGSGSEGSSSEGGSSEGSGSENSRGAETGSGSESNGSGTGSAADTVRTGGIITNTQETIVVIATKTWENYDKSTDAPDGATVTFKLYADEVATGKQVVLDGEPETLGETEADPYSETAAWTAEFRSLPKYQADGKTEIVYTIEESVKYPGYTPDKDTTTDQGTIKNEEDKTSVTVTKVWDNADGSDSAPANAEVTFELYEDGDATGQKAVLNEANGWTAAFVNLQKYVRGTENEHVYVVKEVEGAPDYTNKDPDGAKDGGTITNAQDRVDIPVEKVWRHGDGTAVWPKDVTVTVALMNGETKVREAELSAKQPAYTFENVPEKDAAGKVIDYTVEETDVTGVPDNYAVAVTGTKESGFTITNTQKEAALTISKTVVSDVPADAQQTFTFTVTLSSKINGDYSGITFKDGVGTVRIIGTAAKIIEGLPVGASYEVTEAEVDHFEQTDADGAEGTITAEGARAAFENTRKKGALTIAKRVENVSGKNQNDTFTFTVTLVDTPITKTYSGVAFKDGVAEIALKQGASKTIEGLPDGVKYTVREAGTDHYSQTEAEGAEGTISDAAKQTAAFTNTYEAAGTIAFGGTKTLGHRILAEGEYSFILKELLADGSERAIETVTNAADGSFTFAELSYGPADLDQAENGLLGETVKTYTISEVIPAGGDADAHVRYDETVYQVNVTLEDQGDGTIKVTPDKDPKAAAFTNVYSSEGSVDIEALKLLEGRKLADGQFRFELLEGTKVIATASNDADGKILFSAEDIDELNYTQADIDTKTMSGTKTYTIREVVPEKPARGYQYDAGAKTVVVTLSDNGEGTITAVADRMGRELTFTNRYAADGSVVLSAYKTLEGRKVEAGLFTFELKDAAGQVLDTKTNDADGNVVFDVLQYTEADLDGAEEKTFAYTISEVPGENAAYTYDETVQEVTVTLKDGGAGELFASADRTGTDVAFANVYEAKGEVVLAAAKVLEGRKLAEGQFTFVLSDADGNVLQTKTNAADGAVTFDPITYTEADLVLATGEGTKTYTVSEIIPEERALGYTYDETVYTVTVTLKDQGDGTITAEPDLTADDVKFVNSYKEPHYTEVDVTKKLKSEDGDLVLLAGAQLKVVRLKADGTEVEVDAWTSEEAAHRIVDDSNPETTNTDLRAGIYKLYETAVPNKEYFEMADAITFEVSEDGRITVDGKTVTEIVMLDPLTDKGEEWYEEEKRRISDDENDDSDKTEDGDKDKDKDKDDEKTGKSGSSKSTSKSSRTTTKKSNGAKTGDETNAALPLAGGGLAALVLLWLMLEEKKRRSANG